MLPARPHRGYTMIELVIVLAIIGIVGRMAYATMGGIKNRGKFVSATGDLLEGARRTRAEAFSRGAPCVFVIDTVGGRWWSIADLNLNFSLASFSAATPAPAPDVLLATGTLDTSPTPNVTFGPAGSPGGYGAALPQPYAGVPSFSGSTPAPNLPFCSFCNAGTGFGAITFYGAGGAIFSGGGAAIGHQFTVQAPEPSGTHFQVMTIAVIGRTGAVTNFETTK